jgi:hypothetical protein
MFVVGLLAVTALSGANFVEPNEDAMREAFASDLSDGVRGVLAYVAETGGPEALARIRDARTDEFEVRAFRKVECRPSAPGHVCALRSRSTPSPDRSPVHGGPLLYRAWGLTYDQTTEDRRRLGRHAAVRLLSPPLRPALRSQF